MNILINTQSFHVEMLYSEIIEISKKSEINTIYLVSSLMHDLDKNTFLKYSNIQKVIMIKSTTFFNDTEFKGSDFHLPNELIESSQSIYTDVLSSYRWLPITLRKEFDMNTFSMQFYYDVSNYWNNFFNTNNIDCVIQLNEEHSSVDSILVRSAKNRGIKNILTSRIVGAYSANFEEYHAIYDNSNEKYIKVGEYNLSPTVSTKLSENSDFKSFSKKYKSNKKEKLRYLFNRLNGLIKENTSISEKLNNLSQVIFNKFKTKLLLINQSYYIKDLKKHYNSISVQEVNYDQKYIYYCLHFDPEANTLPKDVTASNQLLNLRILSSSIPEDWMIYIKEHPHQLDYKLYRDILLNQLHAIDNFRSKSFYTYISSLKNVKLLNLNAEHKKLINNAVVVASNTGTIFRECSYLKKFCITFSNKSIYNNLKSVYFVNDIVTCRKVITDITQKDNNIESLVDELFEDYSITITNIQNKAGLILQFITNNKLYRLNND